MTGLMRSLLQVVFLGTLAMAIPLSLIEDVKEMRLKTPPRSNKVKRAQEVIMFGNQQNRGTENRGSNIQRTEKRAASDIDDNSVSDVVPLANVLPRLEDNSYESNRLEAGAEMEPPYQYAGHAQPVYNYRIRNPQFRQQFYTDPAFSELGMYNMVDARRKRETNKHLQNNYKIGFRNKRELDFNPDDLLPLIKLWEAEQRNKFRDSRLGWPNYGNENEDYDSGDNQEENEIEPDSEYVQNGHWIDTPITLQHIGNGEFLLPHQHKRFMVSKRRTGEEGYGQMLGNVNKESTAGGRNIPLYRRAFVL